MPIDGEKLVSILLGALLVSVRVMGAFYFLPFPGTRQAARQVKAMVIFAITLSLYSFWPTPDPGDSIISLIVSGIFKEASIGICLGLVMALTTECLTFCFHLVGLQAGYTYASIIDPTSQADVSVLESLGNLAAGLLFFAMGMHHAVLRAFADSLLAHPAGTWTIGTGIIEPAIRLFQMMLSTGLRLAFPVLAAMVMIDLALALVGRVNNHLQLILLALPAKMLASLFLIGLILMVIPSVYGEFAHSVLTEVRRALQ